MEKRIIKNYMEVLVFNELADFLEQYPDVCKCEYCRCDIAALALNQLPPRYIATKKGELILKVELNTVQGRSDILSALTQAAIRVNKNPKHNL